MTCRLLVEGIDEVEAISHLLRPRGFEKLTELRSSVRVLWHALHGDLEVVNAGSREKAIQRISVDWKSSPAPDHVGVIVDWEYEIEDQTRPWPSLRAHILKAIPQPGPGLPNDEPLSSGLVLSSDSGRRLGVWIMPDNTRKGTLETFLLTRVAANPLFDRAKAAVDGIPEAERLFRHRIDKAYMHTYLAWQEEPGVAMGTAITSRYLGHDSTLSAVFIDWLERLIAS